MSVETELLLRANYEQLERAAEALTALSIEAAKAKSKTDALAGGVQTTGKKVADAAKEVDHLGDGLQGLQNAGGPVGAIAGQFSDLRDKVEGASTGLKGVTAALSGVLGVAGAVVVTFTAVGALLAGAVAVGLANLALKVADAADALNDLSNRTNISVERLSLIDAVARTAGASIDDLIGSAESLGAKLAKQDEETGKAIKALDALGVATKTTSGEQKSMLQLQEDIVVAADEAADKSRAEGLAVAALGTSYYKLRTAVLETRASKSDMYDLMAKTGQITTTKLALASDDLNDKISRLGGAFVGMGKSIATAVIPYLSKIVDKIIEVAENAAAVIRRFTGNDTAVERTTEALDKLTAARNNQAAAVAKMEKSELYNSGGVASRALVDARKKLEELNDGYRETARLASGATKAAEEQKRIVIEGSPGDNAIPSSTRSGGGKAKGDAKSGPSAFDDTSFLKQQRDEVSKLAQETDKLNGIEARTRVQLLDAAIAAGEYAATTKTLAASTEQLNGMRAAAAKVDAAEAYRQEAEAVAKLWDNYHRTTAQVATNVEALRRQAAEHRIVAGVLADTTKTQEDAAIAVTKHNLALAEQKVLSLRGTPGVEENTAELVRAEGAVRELLARLGAQTSIREDNLTKTIRDRTTALQDSLDPSRRYLEQISQINQTSATDQQKVQAGTATTTTFAQGAGFDITGTQLETQTKLDAYSKMYAAIDAMRQQDKISEQDAAAFRLQVDQQAAGDRVRVATDFFGELSAATASGTKTMNRIAKAAAVTQATISGYTAISTALAAPPGWPANAVNVAKVTLLQAANLAKIISTGFRGGGYTGDGGTGQVAGVVHGKEFVVNAAATAKNRALLESLNRGGVVQPRSAGTTQINNITIQGGSSGDPSRDRQYARLISDMISQKWHEENSRANRAGGVNNPVTLSFA